MKICYMPVYKDNDYQINNAKVIQETIEIIQTIREQTLVAKPKDTKQYMEKLLEVITKKHDKDNSVSEDGYSDMFNEACAVPFCDPFITA